MKISTLLVSSYNTEKVCGEEFICLRNVWRESVLFIVFINDRCYMSGNTVESLSALVTRLRLMSSMRQ
jgi:hypothetical protein